MAETIGDYMVALAEYLDENSIMEWNPEGNYSSAAIGLFLKNHPLRPDRIVVITPFLDINAITLPQRELQFQIATRGGKIPTDCDEVADIHFKLLHVKHHLVWNGLEIARIRHQSFASLGPDDQGRWERTDNYELLTQRRV